MKVALCQINPTVGALSDNVRKIIDVYNDALNSNCDIIVLPYKFISTDDFYFKFLNNISIKLNKPLLCFYNDDNPNPFNISSNVKFYRTSLFDYSKLFNEFSNAALTFLDKIVSVSLKYFLLSL